MPIRIPLQISGKCGLNLPSFRRLSVYHNYSADNATAVVDDLAATINAQYTTKINEKYGVGFKYANYSGESGRPDTDKIWP
jgi:hypothetical protein